MARIEPPSPRPNLPSRRVGAQRFYGRREVKDLIAYLRLVHNPADQVSLLRVLNPPPRGLGAKSIEAMLESAARSQQTPGVYLLDLGRGTAEAPRAPSAPRPRRPAFSRRAPDPWRG